jgi:ABC-2 type transport system ATP-binding protein
MIRLVDVWHHYGIRPILKNVSLHIPAGELVAVMGPNGMGKSTLLSLVAGLLCPIKGHVEIGGRVRRGTIEDEIAIRKMLVYQPADPYLPLTASGREFLHAVSRLYDIDEQRLLEHADKLLSLFDLADNADSPIRSYSTGQRKKIGICSAIITEAPVMVLDEPFSGGLDSAALLVLSKILKNLAERKDVTVLMAVPVPELVESLAHKIAIVARGEIIAYDSPDGLRKLTGCNGPLIEVLEKIIHPDSTESIDEYLKGGMS